MAYHLQFAIGPDEVVFDLSLGSDTHARVYFGTPASAPLLGTFDGPNESGNDNIREWRSFSVDVTSRFTVGPEHIVEFDYFYGGHGAEDTCHIKDVRVIDTATGITVARPEYPRGAAYTDTEISGHLPVFNSTYILNGNGFIGGDGDSGPTVYNTCTKTFVAGTGGRVRWFLNSGAPNPCPSATGWAIGGASF